MPKADERVFARNAEIYDTTIGWRFVNPAMKARTASDSMPQTGRERRGPTIGVSREAQDAMALASQAKAAAAQASGRLAREIAPVTIPQRKGDPIVVDSDEHPRATTAEALAKLKPLFPNGSVTAGNASGVNDGAAALILASAEAVKKHGLTPLARILGGATAGVPPRIMGIGPAPASQKLLARLGLSTDDLDVFELNEAFAAQGLASLQRCWASRTTTAGEPQRWRHCARPSTRHVGRPASPGRRRLSFAKPAPASRSPPCASASGKESPSRSNAFDAKGEPP